MEPHEPAPPAAPDQGAPVAPPPLIPAAVLAWAEANALLVEACAGGAAEAA